MKSNIKQRVRIVFAAAFGILLASTVTWAVSVHFKRPAPTAIDSGLVLTFNGSLTGLGNGDVVITLGATADPTTTCTNQGGNQAPGQNPGETNVTGSVSIPSNQIKNGNLTFSVATNPPAQPTAAEAGCPSANWTGAITDMSFTSFTLTVIQGTTTVLTQSFTITGGTDNGDVISIPLK